jgi:hypothetical protein
MVLLYRHAGGALNGRKWRVLARAGLSYCASIGDDCSGEECIPGDVKVGSGRIVALHHRSTTLSQIHSEYRCLFP